MKKYIRKVNKKTETIIDKETGELLDYVEKHDTILIDDNEEFLLMYNSFINIIEGWSLSVTDLQLLGYLLNNYSNGVPFTISKHIKEYLSKKNDKAPSSYNNSIKKLIDIGAVISLSGRSHKLNPEFVWRGKRNSRKKAIIELYQDV